MFAKLKSFIIFKDEEADFHIKFLRYALNSRDFTYTQICEDLKLNEGEKVFAQQELQIPSEYFRISGYTNDDNNHPTVRAYKFMLSLEGRSRLLEYDELKEARKNAHYAQIMAFAALVISTAGFLVQIFS